MSYRAQARDCSDNAPGDQPHREREPEEELEFPAAAGQPARSQRKQGEHSSHREVAEHDVAGVDASGIDPEPRQKPDREADRLVDEKPGRVPRMLTAWDGCPGPYRPRNERSRYVAERKKNDVRGWIGRRVPSRGRAVLNQLVWPDRG